MTVNPRAVAVQGVGFSALLVALGGLVSIEPAAFGIPAERVASARVPVATVAAQQNRLSLFESGASVAHAQHRVKVTLTDKRTPSAIVVERLCSATTDDRLCVARGIAAQRSQSATVDTRTVRTQIFDAPVDSADSLDVGAAEVSEKMQP